MSRPQIRIPIIVGALNLILLLLVFGAFKLSAYSADQKEISAQRAAYDRFGNPLLRGPYVPGGPTVGKGSRADIDISDMGWDFYGEKGDPRQIQMIFIELYNKSPHAWKKVKAQVDLLDVDGQKLRTEEYEFGILTPGEKVRNQYKPEAVGVHSYSLKGIVGELILVN